MWEVEVMVVGWFLCYLVSSEMVVLLWEMYLPHGSEGPRNLVVLFLASMGSEQRPKQCDLHGREVWRRKLLWSSVCEKLR